MFSSSGLAEERVVGVVSSSNGFVTGHLSIGLDPVFQTVKLPAGIANLDASLADVDRDTLTLCDEKCCGLRCISDTRNRISPTMVIETMQRNNLRTPRPLI